MAKQMNLKYKLNYLVPLDTEFGVVIQRLGPSIAILYFRDETGKETSIPEDYTLYDLTNKITVKKMPNTEYFPLCWTDNYILKQNHSVILDISSQRGWDLSSSASYNIISM